MTVTPPSHFHERAKRQCETGVFINLTSPLYPRSLLSRSVRDGVLHKPDQNVEDAMWTQLFINLPAFLHYRNKDNGSLFFLKITLYVLLEWSKKKGCPWSWGHLHGNMKGKVSDIAVFTSVVRHG